MKVGDRVPDFKAKAANGEDFDSRSLLGQKPVVIYFYPKDNTPGCTTQACGFRDQYEEFKDLGAEVIGVSSDSVDSHQEFVRHYHLPFILLSDQDKKLRTLFGVPSAMLGLFPGRVTYVVDKDGVIRMIYNTMFADKHIPKALEMVKKVVSDSKG